MTNIVNLRPVDDPDRETILALEKEYESLWQEIDGYSSDELDNEFAKLGRTREDVKTTCGRRPELERRVLAELRKVGVIGLPPEASRGLAEVGGGGGGLFRKFIPYWAIAACIVLVVGGALASILVSNGRTADRYGWLPTIDGVQVGYRNDTSFDFSSRISASQALFGSVSNCTDAERSASASSSDVALFVTVAASRDAVHADRIANFWTEKLNADAAGGGAVGLALLNACDPTTRSRVLVEAIGQGQQAVYIGPVNEKRLGLVYGVVWNVAQQDRSLADNPSVMPIPKAKLSSIGLISPQP